MISPAGLYSVIQRALRLSYHGWTPVETVNTEQLCVSAVELKHCKRSQEASREASGLQLTEVSGSESAW